MLYTFSVSDDADGFNLEDASLLVQEVFQQQNNTTEEESAFVTAVDDTGNLTQDDDDDDEFADLQETVQENVDGRYK